MCIGLSSLNIVDPFCVKINNSWQLVRIQGEVTPLSRSPSVRYCAVWEYQYLNASRNLVVGFEVLKSWSAIIGRVSSSLPLPSPPASCNNDHHHGSNVRVPHYCRAFSLLYDANLAYMAFFPAWPYWNRPPVWRVLEIPGENGWSEYLDMIRIWFRLIGKRKTLVDIEPMHQWAKATFQTIADSVEVGRVRSGPYKTDKHWKTTEMRWIIRPTYNWFFFSKEYWKKITTKAENVCVSIEPVFTQMDVVVFQMDVPFWLWLDWIGYVVCWCPLVLAGPDEFILVPGV